MDAGEHEEITAAAIARLAGVGRAAVSNWRKRYPGFPQPAGGSPASPTFDRAEVVAWLTATGKADQLATAGRTDGGTLRVDAGPQVSGRKGLSFFAPADRSRDSLRRLIEQASRDRSITDLKPGDLLARTMVALLPRSTASAPHSENDLPAVLDPACADGVLLMAIGERFGGRVRLVGQEINEGYARIAAFNLSGNANGAPYEVFTGDSFTDNQLSPYLGKAAAVVCEPPFDPPRLAGSRADDGPALGVRHPRPARRRAGLGAALLCAPAAARGRRGGSLAADLRAAVR